MARKLLLADDSPTIQRVIELTFADEDIEVVTVGDGDQAIARAEADPPDIVLADVGMPGRNGYEVAAHMKRSPRLAHIPVVLLTGAFETVDEGRVNAIGCDGVLAKPFEPQAVIGRVKELLGRERRAVVVPADPSALDHHPAELQSYFDRLDEALAKSSAPGSAQAAVFPIQEPAATRPSPERIDRPTMQTPEPTLPSPAQSPAKTTPSPQVSVPAPAPPAFQARPPLEDAFDALLAAEQGAPIPSRAPVWPAAAPMVPSPASLPAPTTGAPPAALGVTDYLVEQLSRSVLERLSDRVVRETVTDIVSKVAERLVREEIERLKASINER